MILKWSQQGQSPEADKEIFLLGIAFDIPMALVTDANKGGEWICVALCQEQSLK